MNYLTFELQEVSAAKVQPQVHKGRWNLQPNCIADAQPH